jgi:SMI1 / KNR4 family (SUKH-1)
MDHHIKEFYCQSGDDSSRGSFHKVISLHDSKDLDWDTVVAFVPKLSKGWFELAHLPVHDRIEFTRDFWMAKLPYHPYLANFLTRFFDSLDDICVFVFQKKFDDPFEVNLVYSLKDNAGFFRGTLPASDHEIEELQRLFPEYPLPADYKAFLQIHNGFCKTTDCTGISSSTQVEEIYNNFQAMFETEGPLNTNRGSLVNPKTLIPFYESFGMPFFQCFWAEWYPENEMGNVYYSGLTRTIFDVESSDPSSESMAFPTFIDWLMFYMERIE